MFIGEFRHNLDNKGRLAIPAKFRKDLVSGAVVTKGLDDCLFLYPKKDWEVLAQKLTTLPISQANSRAFSRLMLSGAVEADLDVQGRILIPDYLRQYANLGKRVVITGLYNRVEIWDEKTWLDYKAKTEKNSSEIAEKLGELGI